MRIDVNTFLGAYPFRRVPGTSPQALLEAMDRTGVDEAWVTHLPGVFWRNPHEGNGWLLDNSGRHHRLRPVPAVQPEIAGWEEVLHSAVTARAPAVRSDPTYYGIAPAGAAMRALTAACGAAGMPLMLAVRFEDGRQRHPHDVAPELPAAAVRALIRSDSGSASSLPTPTAGSSRRCTSARPPMRQRGSGGTSPGCGGLPRITCKRCSARSGRARFVFGTGQPLRLPENGVAKLDLLDLEPGARAAIESENANRLRGGAPG